VVGASASPIRFGCFLVPEAAAPLLATAQRIERLGLDSVGVQDHPYQRRSVDTWALLAMIAATTTRLRVVPDVACLPLPPPAVLATTAATISLLRGGRLDLGLGAGSCWEAIQADGGPRRTPGQALGALAEAVEVIGKVWSGERNLRLEGRHDRLVGAQSGPVPDHRIGIWLGVDGPRALGLAGRVADGWGPSFGGDPAALGEMTRRLEDAATAAGRDPWAVRRILNGNGTITDRRSGGLLRGPVQQWAEELTGLAVGSGFDTFRLWAEGDAQLDRFAQAVVPAARQQLAAQTS
jgi:alkanesulfonate monooxygenase SsuD/methylene tetrahydromethanopterin reductase-like flavin-dependent oxidoreductase (luciferase family)